MFEQFTEYGTLFVQYVKYFSTYDERLEDVHEQQEILFKVDSVYNNRQMLVRQMIEDQHYSTFEAAAIAMECWIEAILVDIQEITNLNGYLKKQDSLLD